MALIKCPECGKDVSDKAKACPKCGYPIDEYVKESTHSKPVEAAPQKNVKTDHSPKSTQSTLSVDDVSAAPQKKKTGNTSKKDILVRYEKYKNENPPVLEMINKADCGDLAAEYYLVLYYAIYKKKDALPADIIKLKDKSNTAGVVYNIHAIRNNPIFESDDPEKAAEAEKAWKYITKMAKNGNNSACGIFGYYRSIYHGFDTNTFNITEGYKYMEKAAPNYEPFSCAYLGKALADGYYCDGKKVEKNTEKAKKYLEIAIKYGEYGIERYQTATKALEYINNGCFITSAVCKSFNKSDDCYELTTFRRFRDEWLLKESDGKQIIDEYYRIAPRIVEKIDASGKADKVYRMIWDRYLSECLRLLEERDYYECKKLYIQMVEDLKMRFLSNACAEEIIWL